MKNRNVLILGGSSDIGIEVVKKFLELKWNVYAHYLKNKKNLIFLKKKYKALNIIKFNFNDYKNLKTETNLKKKFNKNYDTVINLVGYVDNVSFEKTNYKSLIKSLTTNAIAPILLEKILVKKMLVKKWGRILNCSSIGVKFGGGNNTFNYGVAKHCLEFIPNNYKEWAKKNICINNLRIGVTDTKIHKKIKKKLSIKNRIKLIPAARMAKADEISNYIVGLVSEKNSYMTGQTITVAGGE